MQQSAHFSIIHFPIIAIFNGSILSSNKVLKCKEIFSEWIKILLDHSAVLQATHNNIVESIFKWVPTNYLALGQFLSSPNICWLYCSIYSKVTSNNCLCKRRIMAVGPLILLLPISYSQQYSKNVLGPIKQGKRIPFLRKMGNFFHGHAFV